MGSVVYFSHKYINSWGNRSWNKRHNPDRYVDHTNYGIVERIDDNWYLVSIYDKDGNKKGEDHLSKSYLRLYNKEDAMVLSL